MRVRDVNLTLIVLRTLLILQISPIVLSCIYLLNGWTPMSVENRTTRADIVLSGHVIRAFKEHRYRTEAMTYPATIKLFEVYKGRKFLSNITASVEVSNIYNISNFGDRKMCYADIDEGHNYIFFLTTYKQRLSAKYDDIFGAVAKYTEENVKQVLSQVEQGVSDWSDWSACSKLCDGGTQVRMRNCTDTNTSQCNDVTEQRSCNTFNCAGVHDLLSYLGVYKLPLGVYRDHQRSGAFNITRIATLFTTFTEIYPHGPKNTISIILSVNVQDKFRGDILTLSEPSGEQVLAIGLTQKATSTVIVVENSDHKSALDKETNLSGKPSSVVFDIHPKMKPWQQFAISFTKETVQLHYDCDTVAERTLAGFDFSQVDDNLMVSIGSYLEKNGQAFQGGVEQLAIVDGDIAASQQCSTDQDRAIKDEGDNAIDEMTESSNTEERGDKLVDDTTPEPTDLEPLAEWTEWSQCSRSCGRGVQTRTLYCGGNVISACSRLGQESEQARWCYLGPCQVGCVPECRNGGRCLQSTGTCFCPQGYSGSACQHVDCEFACMNGGRCVEPGVCACPVGYTGNACQTAVCNPACGNGGHCIQPGYCACPYGYMPPNCDPICILPCRNGGRCVRHNQCKCPRGFVGVDCSMPVCRRGCYNGGRCVAPGKCKCPRGFTGSRCHKPQCKPECQNKGRCLYPGICQCKRGFTGLLCEEPVCRKECQNGGVCSGENRCACLEGYRGRWCHKPIKSKKCRVTCLNGGKCRKNKCKCKKGFSGDRCQKRKCNFETYLAPYIQTYRQYEKYEVVTSCETWQWSACVETRVRYVLASRTMYKTSYRCV